MVAMVRMENGILSRMESSAGVYSGKSGGESMKRPQKLAVMLVPTPPYEICGLVESDPMQALKSCAHNPFAMTATLSYWFALDPSAASDFLRDHFKDRSTTNHLVGLSMASYTVTNPIKSWYGSDPDAVIRFVTENSELSELLTVLFSVDREAAERIRKTRQSKLSPDQVVQELKKGTYLTMSLGGLEDLMIDRSELGDSYRFARLYGQKIGATGEAGRSRLESMLPHFPVKNHDEVLAAFYRSWMSLEPLVAQQALVNAKPRKIHYEYARRVNSHEPILGKSFRNRIQAMALEWIKSLPEEEIRPGLLIEAAGIAPAFVADKLPAIGDPSERLRVADELAGWFQSNPKEFAKLPVASQSSVVQELIDSGQNAPRNWKPAKLAKMLQSIAVEQRIELVKHARTKGGNGIPVDVLELSHIPARELGDLIEEADLRALQATREE